MGAPASQVVSLRILPETRRLVVIMRGGDITVIALDEQDLTVRFPLLSVDVFLTLHEMIGGSRRNRGQRYTGCVLVSR